MESGEDPGAAWMALMRRGAWSAAWRLSDAALAARKGARDWTLPRHLQAVWDGTPLGGRRVLVRCNHGLGDTIQFARLLPALQAIAREVTVWAQPSLIPLLATLRGPPRLMALHDGAPEGDWDAEIEIMELAHALRLDPARRAAAVAWPAHGRATWVAPLAALAAELRRLAARAPLPQPAGACTSGGNDRRMYP